MFIQAAVIRVGIYGIVVLCYKNYMCKDTKCIQSVLTEIKSVDRYISVGVATRYGLDGLGIESRWLQTFPHPFRPVLGPNLLYYGDWFFFFLE